jgi:hypothetical protein
MLFNCHVHFLSDVRSKRYVLSKRMDLSYTLNHVAFMYMRVMEL